MATSEAYLQTDQLFPSTIDALDSNNGVMFRNIGDLPHIDPERPITLPRLCKELGNTLGWAIEAPDEDDLVIGVSHTDLEAADVGNIERGLYRPIHGAGKEQLVTITPDEIVMDGRVIVPEGFGVVFPSDEFNRFPKNPEGIARSVQSNIRERNRFSTDRGEVKRRIQSGAGQTLQGYLRELDTQEVALVDERNLLRSVYKIVANPRNAVWQAHYKGSKLDKMRQDADELIHEAVETALINLNLDTKEEAAVHRSVFKRMYREGSSTDLARNIKQYTHMTGHWASARHAKVRLARSACTFLLESRLPAIEAGLDREDRWATSP